MMVFIEEKNNVMLSLDVLCSSMLADIPVKQLLNISLVLAFYRLYIKLLYEFILFIWPRLFIYSFHLNDSKYEYIPKCVPY